jgi:hypothetical protein
MRSLTLPSVDALDALDGLDCVSRRATAVLLARYSALDRFDLTSITCRPRYVPQLGQAWCESRTWRHWGQTVSWGILIL